MSTSIFITYNPASEAERTLAIRLHTIGAVTGFTMYLPDRYNSETYLDNETKARIQASRWFVYFSSQSLSPIVRQEIEYALSIFPDKRRIIIVYSSVTGKNLWGAEQCTEIAFDPRTQTVDEIVMQILAKISAEKDTGKRSQRNDQNLNALLALLGIGVGFLALNELMHDEPPNVPRQARTSKKAVGTKSGTSKKSNTATRKVSTKTTAAKRVSRSSDTRKSTRSKKK